MLPVKSSLLPTVSRFFDDDWNNLFDWKADQLLAKKLSFPSVNIQESDSEYFVEMAAPGLVKENFKIQHEKNRLTISYHQESSQEREERYVRKEYDFTSFSRSFHLNKNIVDDDRINASYTDGILRVLIPKREEAKEKPARLIDIA